MWGGTGGSLWRCKHGNQPWLTPQLTTAHHHRRRPAATAPATLSHDTTAPLTAVHSDTWPQHNTMRNIQQEIVLPCPTLSRVPGPRSQYWSWRRSDSANTSVTQQSQQSGPSTPDSAHCLCLCVRCLSDCGDVTLTVTGHQADTEIAMS